METSDNDNVDNNPDKETPKYSRDEKQEGDNTVSSEDSDSEQSSEKSSNKGQGPSGENL